ncbi:DivIVA domain-containing protein [Virgibacillus sp. CBA3643]|uniref:DivIVA domain-containing protein n=1 Tax=Virgibacillus sp. CBA3643 TaxID=2942278 RepID=UPI0035A3AFD4
MDKKQANFSAMDVHEVRFRRSFRGYNEYDIDNFIDKVIEDYEALNREIDRLNNEVDQLKKGYR